MPGKLEFVIYPLSSETRAKEIMIEYICTDVVILQRTTREPPAAWFPFGRHVTDNEPHCVPRAATAAAVAVAVGAANSA